jgi:hypothetical protein
LTNQPCKDDNGREIYSPVNAKQTPRSATIEEEHIIRAYVYENLEDQERIEIYGLSSVLNKVISPKKDFIPLRFEPEDNAAEGTGRNYDWGRAVFASQTDERTAGGHIDV